MSADDVSAGGAGEVPPEDEAGPAAEVVAHLQSAALEVIAAVRAFLDAAEVAVKDPAGAAAAAATLAGRAGRRPPRTGEDGGNDDGRVQRIPVS